MLREMQFLPASKQFLPASCGTASERREQLQHSTIEKGPSVLEGPKISARGSAVLHFGMASWQRRIRRGCANFVELPNFLGVDSHSIFSNTGSISPGFFKVS